MDFHLSRESCGVDFHLSRESRGCRAEVGSARPRQRTDKAERLEGGGIKGCSILAELLESGKDQPWGGSGPPQPQPIEEPVDVPVPWRAASCLHWDGKHQAQAASRVLQTLATNLWVPLGRDQHRDEACEESLSSKGRRGAGWEVQDLLAP